MARSSATLMIDIAANIAKLRTGFEQAENVVGNFGKKINSLSRTLKVGLAGVGLGIGLNSIRQMASAAGDIGESAEAVGLGVENYQALTLALAQAGIESEKTSAMLAKSATLFGKALEGDKASIDTLKDLGVGLIDAQGNVRDFDGALIDLAQAISSIESPMQKVAKAREAFGRGGEKMIPALEQMAKGFAALRQSSELGILSPEAVKNFDAFFDRSKVLSEFLKTQFLEGLNAITQETGFKTAIKDMDDAIVNLSKAMAEFNKSDWPKIIGGGFSVMLAPITLTINGISLLIGWINKIPDAFSSVWKTIKIGALEFKVWAAKFGGSTAQDLEDIKDAMEQLAKLRATGGQGFGGPEPATGLGGGSKDDKKYNLPGSKADADKMETMLAKIREEASKANDAVGILTAKMREPVDNPQAQRQAEMYATVASRIREISAEFKAAKITPSTEDQNKINAWVLSTEKAKLEAENLTAVMTTAAEVRATWGDGMVVLAEQTRLLDEALANQLITVDQYVAAMKKAKEAQEDQQASADKMKTGLDGIAAGFEYAMKKSARANTEFEMGEQIFTNLFEGMSSAIMQFVETGEVNFGKLAASFAAMLAQMAAQLAAQAALRFILAAIGGSGSAVETPGYTGSVYDPPTFNPNYGGPRAAGGPVDPSRWYMVGENGPERFVPNVAGRIEPSRAGTTDGGPSITINNNAPGVDVKTERTSQGDLMFTIEKVRAALTRDIQRGGNSFSHSISQAYNVARVGR